MPRYVTLRQPRRQTRSDYGYEPYVQPLGHPVVYDPGPVDTGLLDKDGNRIYRSADQIGFVERK
jgi:hypothetical protein